MCSRPRRRRQNILEQPCLDVGKQYTEPYRLKLLNRNRTIRQSANLGPHPQWTQHSSD